MDRKSIFLLVLAAIAAFSCGFECGAHEQQQHGKQRRGIIGWVLRGAIWHALFGAADPAPEAETQRRQDVARSQAVDFAEGW